MRKQSVPGVEKQGQPEPADLGDVKNEELQQFFNEMEDQNEGYCYYHVKADIDPQIDGSIAQVKQTIMARLGMNSAFLAKPHVWPEYAHLSVEQLHQELGAKRVELKEINQKIQELETSIGMARFDRFEEFG